MKILNLYAGIGGNRKLWGNEHEITAVEIDSQTAEVYKDLFPYDNVILGDAHQYLLDQYYEFDFIWSSPPCPSHSKINFSMNRQLEYPDMKLYQEVIFLKQWFKGLYVVENVIPYYQPLIHGKEIERHLFWSNFRLGNYSSYENGVIRKHQIPDYERIFGYDLSKYKLKNKRQKLRNCVNPELGEYILDCALGTIKNKSNQLTFL